MSLKSLAIAGFRNLRDTDLVFSSRLNLFTGENAAGKTSLLEAIYILGRASSFRSSSLDRAICHQQEGFTLVAQLESGERTLPVGIRRTPGQLLARIDGRPVRRLSELAALFPLQWVGGNIHELLEGGPPLRRQFMDWGLFHVKQDYIPAWKQFQKLLKQRNAALRAARPPREISVWDRDLAASAELLDRHRSSYLAEVGKDLTTIMEEFLENSADLDIQYRRGWSADRDYRTILEESLASDREQGFTRRGPQRADFSLRYQSRPVTEALSRGQQKLLVIGLKLAQALLLRRETGRRSLFLLDDIGAELDLPNQTRVMRKLGELDAQVFATAIDFPAGLVLDGEASTLFHVKHGEVTEVV